MGGAERTARKRRQEQQARNAVAQARGGGNGKRIALIIGVLVLVAAVIIGGVLWTNASQNETEGQQIPAAEPVRSEHPETRDGVVVETGSPDAGATIDVYVDFLCPACGQFHETFGQQINQKVADGSLRVRTHMVPMLTEQSSPPGYSLDAANAALLAADEGRFTRFHDSLFESQPAEGARAYDDDQLIQLGRDIGIESEAFAEGIRGGTYDQQLQDAFEETANDRSLHQEGPQGTGFSTPTVTHNGQVVELDENWLDRVTSGGGS